MLKITVLLVILTFKMLQNSDNKVVKIDGNGKELAKKPRKTKDQKLFKF